MFALTPTLSPRRGRRMERRAVHGLNARVSASGNYLPKRRVNYQPRIENSALDDDRS